MADTNNETPDAGRTANGAAGVNSSQSSDAAGGHGAAPAAPAASAPAASAPAASAPAVSAEIPSRVRLLLIPGIADSAVDTDTGDALNDTPAEETG